MEPITVRHLNFYVKSLIEGDQRLNGVAVTGEISNFKSHYSSGHWYFTLKDADAAVRCVMFRSAASRVKFAVTDGMKVILKGRVSLYEKDGQYQFYAEEILPDGAGDIAIAFEQIKQKLMAEGLFDPENKRPVPKFPKCIAVVTSNTGAAVRDIINILTRRYPISEILMCPVSVQGELAVPEMVNALDRLYKLGKADVIIIGRGGGSIEDLWAFNSEILARKIYESPIPVISAVGHETDFTICDFVADLRAPTPSAAAELAVPDMQELLVAFNGVKRRLNAALNNRYRLDKNKLDKILLSRCFRIPESIFAESGQHLDKLIDRMNISVDNTLKGYEKQFVQITTGLDALSPLKVMARGFAVPVKNGNRINSVTKVNKGESIDIIMSDGKLGCLVEEISNGK